MASLEDTLEQIKTFWTLPRNEALSVKGQDEKEFREKYVVSERYDKGWTSPKGVFGSSSTPKSFIDDEPTEIDTVARKVGISSNIVDVMLVGSRITVSPPPTDTDEDILLRVLNLPVFITDCLKEGYHADSLLYSGGLPASGFISLRKGETNLIITESIVFYDGFALATKVCKELNLTYKPDRIMVHAAIIEKTFKEPTHRA
jgi:hypothetical protein